MSPVLCIHEYAVDVLYCTLKEGTTVVEGPEPEPEPERCSSRGFFHGTTTGRADAAAALSSQAAARPPCSALHCRPAPAAAQAAAPIYMHACNKDRSIMHSHHDFQ